jgi:hypothetical protein
MVLSASARIDIPRSELGVASAGCVDTELADSLSSTSVSPRWRASALGSDILSLRRRQAESLEVDAVRGRIIVMLPAPLLNDAKVASESLQGFYSFFQRDVVPCGGVGDLLGEQVDLLAGSHGLAPYW